MFLKYDSHNEFTGVTTFGAFTALFLGLVLFGSAFFFEIVDKGTVKVGYRFGAYTETITQGMNFPVDPFVTWHEIDTMQQSAYFEGVKLPTRDQQKSTIDLSIQYRAIGVGTIFSVKENKDLPAGHIILDETGSVEDVVTRHLIPHMKGALRQAGRSIEKAEMLFDDGILGDAEEQMLAYLKPILLSKGFNIEAVILRDVELPIVIRTAIDEKKKREQLAETQKAELRRFETEQQQVIKTATAERAAAVINAEKIKLLADAKAYEITKVNDAAATSPMYLQLQAVKAFGKLGEDPSTKIIMLDGSGNKVFPFLNLGADFDK